MNETRQKGNFTGGTIIYGYKVENHKVVIDEEKAEVVRFIYNQYSQGVYVKDIIKTLTERGIFNRGKKFARNTVYNILKAVVLFLPSAERLKTDRKYAITNVWDENTKAVAKSRKSGKKYSKNMYLTTYANKCNTPKY